MRIKQLDFVLSEFLLGMSFSLASDTFVLTLLIITVCLSSVGVNCLFDPDTTVKTIKLMKDALDAAGLSPYLMTQPNGFWCPRVGNKGYLSCPEFPYGKCHCGGGLAGQWGINLQLQ